METLPLWLNLVIFAASAAVVWLAGTRLTRYADSLSRKTGLGKALIGALLLGGITSLPEIATTVSAALIGNVALAVNNLFGGVTMQVAILAVADAASKGVALSSMVAAAAVSLQGIFLVVMLALAILGILIGGPVFLGVGLWAWLILVMLALAFWLAQRQQALSAAGAEAGVAGATGEADPPLAALVRGTALAAAVILGAGFALARVGDVLAVQTGLGSSFVGAVLVAVSTSLPELSTTIAAVRLKQYTMAFANVFGTNLIDVASVFLADAVYAGNAVLSEVGLFSVVAALLGVAVTGVYLAGLRWRRKPVIWRVGPDSLLVLGLYLGGLVALYALR